MTKTIITSLLVLKLSDLCHWKHNSDNVEKYVNGEKGKIAKELHNNFLKTQFWKKLIFT